MRHRSLERQTPTFRGPSEAPRQRLSLRFSATQGQIRVSLVEERHSSSSNQQALQHSVLHSLRLAFSGSQPNQRLAVVSLAILSLRQVAVAYSVAVLLSSQQAASLAALPPLLNPDSSVRLSQGANLQRVSSASPQRLKGQASSPRSPQLKAGVSSAT